MDITCHQPDFYFGITHTVLVWSKVCKLHNRSNNIGQRIWLSWEEDDV